MRAAPGFNDFNWCSLPLLHLYPSPLSACLHLSVVSVFSFHIPSFLLCSVRLLRLGFFFFLLASWMSIHCFWELLVRMRQYPRNPVVRESSLLLCLAPSVGCLVYIYVASVNDFRCSLSSHVCEPCFACTLTHRDFCPPINIGAVSFFILSAWEGMDT